MSFDIEAAGAFSSAILFLAHLGLCAASVQGGLVKLTDFPGAVAEMKHFRLTPPTLFAVLVIALELITSAMVMRWLDALALAGFTLEHFRRKLNRLRCPNLLFLRNSERKTGTHFCWMCSNIHHDRAKVLGTIHGQGTTRGREPPFFEHLGLNGGFLLIAWMELVRAPNLNW